MLPPSLSPPLISFLDSDDLCRDLTKCSNSCIPSDKDLAIHLPRTVSGLTSANIALFWLALGGVFYIVGALLYVNAIQTLFLSKVSHADLSLFSSLLFSFDTLNYSILLLNRLSSYAERTPERFAPGRFDFFGSSHQIFHILICLAAWSHFTCITEGFRYHHGERNGLCVRLVSFD